MAPLVDGVARRVHARRDLLARDALPIELDDLAVRGRELRQRPSEEGPLDAHRIRVILQALLLETPLLDGLVDLGVPAPRSVGVAAAGRVERALALGDARLVALRV